MGVCCCAVVLLTIRHKEDSTSTISRTAKEDSSNDKGVGNERQEIRDVIYRLLQPQLSGKSTALPPLLHSLSFNFRHLSVSAFDQPHPTLQLVDEVVWQQPVRCQQCSV